VVRPVVEDPLQHGTQRRAGRPLEQLADQDLVDDLLHVLVAQHGDDALRGGRELGGHAFGVGQLPDPLPHAPGDLDTPELVAHHVLGQEVLADEVAEAVAELVLLARDDRGVRDRQAHRPPEERGDGEPVGQRADHRGLGGGADVAHPVRRADRLAPPREQEDHGRTQQETGRQHLHAA
jgi:hypothetical protein